MCVCVCVCERGRLLTAAEMHRAVSTMTHIPPSQVKKTCRLCMYVDVMHVCVRAGVQWTNLVTYEAGLDGEQLHAEAHGGDGHGSRGNDRSAPGHGTINTFPITLNLTQNSRLVQHQQPAGASITTQLSHTHIVYCWPTFPYPSPRRFRTRLRPRCGFSARHRTCCPPNARCSEPAWAPTKAAYRGTWRAAGSSAHHVQQSSAEQFFWSMYARHLLTGLGGTGPGAGATSSNSSASASNECFWCGALAPRAAPRSVAANRSWRLCCMLACSRLRGRSL